VWNGDSGVVVATPSGPRVALPGGTAPRELAPSRLGDVETMHAMTIHKSQGSQAVDVTVLLPEVDSRLLTRELLYTAVTRAQRHVRVVGTEAELRAAFERRVQRASGLRDRLRASLAGG
jgi:exodeoxyribonuclease V alpha subunit